MKQGWRLGWRRGSLLIMTLVFVAMFGVIFAALAGMVNRTYHESVLQAKDETAFQVAEAGLNYARWRLAHDPENFVSETRSVDDPIAGVLGEFTVSFEEPQAGSTVVVITSVGYTAGQPSRQVTVEARYGRPSMARFSALYNDDYWYGESETVAGPVHSNGGIRMDGTSDSIVTSARETYVCQPRHGCNNVVKPGVWGVGQEQELWEFPAAPVDFNALTLDLLNMRSAAEEAGTYYGSSGKQGYHLVFNGDGTYAVYRVTKLGPKVNSWSSADGTKNLSHDIGEEELVEVRAVPDNGIVYAEDTLWVEGDIDGRVTVAAGVFPDAPGTNVDIIINGSISYGGVRDGSRAFGAVAQRDILVPWSAAPNLLQLDGAFVAQKGSFGRRYYSNSGAAAEHAIKQRFELYGMVAFNVLTVDMTWVSGSEVTSGYRETQRAYDPHFIYAPPPYFPTSGQYEFISWEEEQ